MFAREGEYTHTYAHGSVELYELHLYSVVLRKPEQKEIDTPQSTPKA